MVSSILSGARYAPLYTSCPTVDATLCYSCRFVRLRLVGTWLAIFYCCATFFPPFLFIDWSIRLRFVGWFLAISCAILGGSPVVVPCVGYPKYSLILCYAALGFPIFLSYCRVALCILFCRRHVWGCRSPTSLRGWGGVLLFSLSLRLAGESFSGLSLLFVGDGQANAPHFLHRGVLSSTYKKYIYI